jgi:predicted CopG family antitoxin
MAVKTIMIGMEAYELLAAQKHGNESFSRVIKRRLRPARTAAAVLERLPELALEEETLDLVEGLVSARRASPVSSPVLDEGAG